MKIYTVKPSGGAYEFKSRLRSAYRNWGGPSYCRDCQGFRLVFKDNSLVRSGCIRPTVTYRGTGTRHKTSFRFVI